MKSIPSARLIATLLATVAMGPTMVAAGGGAYMSSEYTIRPEYVIGGILLVFLMSIFILRWAAMRIFGLIDTVPKLSNDVSSIKDDVSEIKDTVKNLLPWKENVEKRLSVIEFRLGGGSK